MQMETDTTTEEREVLLQRAIEATNLGHRDQMGKIIAQMREHIRMYDGDEGLWVLKEQLEKMEALLTQDAPAAGNDAPTTTSPA
jgi:hypothetical protein